MVFATGNAPASPWPFFVGALLLIVVFFGTWSAVWFRSDRKRRTRSGSATPPPWDNGAVCIPATVVLNGRSPLDLAETVIRNEGATEVHVIDNAVIGWIGRERAFRVPLQASRQAYEVGIATISSNGSTQFQCCARPQLGVAVVGANRARELATMLARAVAALANEGPT